MRESKLRIGAAFLVVSTVWGSTWVAIKIGLETVPPFLSAGLRFVIAASVLYLLLRMNGLRVGWTRDARRVYLTLGILSITLPFALVYWGQQFIPSALGSILFAVFPFWVAVGSHLMLPDERLTLPKLVGIVLGFIGLVVIFGDDLSWGGSAALPGMAAVLVSTMLQAYSLIVVKKYGQPVSPFVMNFVGMSIGAVGLLTLSVAVEPIGAAVWSPQAVGSILYLAIVGSVLTFVSYYWLVKRIDAVYLSLTSFVNPIVAVILGAAVLGERMAPAVFSGAALVLAGILIANAPALRERARRWRGT